MTSMGSWTSVGKNHTGMEITMSRTLEQTIIGNLGAPVEGWYDDDSDLEETEGAKRDMEEDEDQEGMAEFGEGGLEMKGMGVTQKQHTGRSRRQIAVEVTQEVIVRHDSVGEDGRSEIDIESRKGGRSFAPAVDSDRPGL